jgi:spermidine/putrescine-binding protein
MRITFLRRRSVLLMILFWGLVACAGNTPAQTGVKTTSSGYECPAAEFPVKLESKELNLLVWTEYIPLDMIECFELVHQVKVNRYQYSSNEEMYVKVAAGGVDYDLAQPSGHIIPLMAREGHLQELEHSRLPSFANFDPNWMDQPFDPGNKYSIPYLAGTDAIIVNTATVETIPTSWADLWSPEYAGRIIFIDDARAAIGFTLITLGYDPNTTNPAELEEAQNRLLELVPNIKLFDSDSPKTSLIAGEVDLGMVWTGEAFIANQENPDLQYIYPEEGPVLWQDNWVILKDAPHADAAYAWLNYTAQGNVFWITIRDFHYTNPNAAALEYAKANEVKVYEAYINSPITNPPAEVIAKGFGIEDVGEATPLYDNIWVKIKGGR